MTDRERWTVYPLLFLTLGIALRGKLSPDFTCKQLVTDKLLLRGPDGQVSAVLGSLPSEAGGGGEFQLLTNEGAAVTMLARPTGGVIQTNKAGGLLQTSIHPAPVGGALELFSNNQPFQGVLTMTPFNLGPLSIRPQSILPHPLLQVPPDQKLGPKALPAAAGEPAAPRPSNEPSANPESKPADQPQQSANQPQPPTDQAK